jgi:hypothetical protein
LRRYVSPHPEAALEMARLAGRDVEKMKAA